MDIQSILLQWQSVGVFDYLLPFLLIFALVFGIMQKTHILGTKENPEKGINVLVGVVISLLSLQLDLVPRFFQEAFPRLGVGLVVLFCLMILMYMFIDDKSGPGLNYGLLAVGFVIAIVIFSQSFEQFGWSGSFGYDQYVGWIVGAVLLIGVIIAISSSGSGKPR